MPMQKQPAASRLCRLLVDVVPRAAAATVNGAPVGVDSRHQTPDTTTMVDEQQKKVEDLPRN
jgi:hypothetical protein